MCFLSGAHLLHGVTKLSYVTTCLDVLLEGILLDDILLDNVSYRRTNLTDISYRMTCLWGHILLEHISYRWIWFGRKCDMEGHVLRKNAS